MTKNNNVSDTFMTLKSEIELELLDTLLTPEDATYPWTPANVESEAYFSQLEQQFVTQDWLDETLSANSLAFYETLDQLWSEVVTTSNYKSNPNKSAVDHLQVSLNSAFAHIVPPSWLNSIAKKAAEISASQQSISDRLVQCVQSVLPAWDVDDLLVLTRPFVHAMRSSKSPDLTLMISQVKHQDWLTLSEIEQAKISVAIADYAFRQLKTFQSQH